MKIIGAGLAGLIAAHAIQNCEVIESQRGPKQMHGALLRFRSDAVGELTGIKFRPVTVRKGIWNNGWQQPSISQANMYSRKVVGKLMDRSIWNLESVTRYIAPEDFYERLIDNLGSRVKWNTPFEFSGRNDEPIISTAPMPVSTAHWDHGIKFERAPIKVIKYRLRDCDLHQTVYFTTNLHGLYRASITGNTLICEFVNGGEEFECAWLTDLLAAFEIFNCGMERIGEIEQSYGKIAPIDEIARRAIITKLTDDHNIYSVGRFATWRNILLDDVVHDIAVVKQLIGQSAYHRKIYQGGLNGNG